jgi:ABC-2 type transport system permease protein
MRVFWILLKKELHSFFVSPVAWIILALIMAMNGFSFRAALAILEEGPSEGSIVTWTFFSRWFWFSYFFVFPLLTMRLFSEEKKLGTFETLFTAPVRAWQVVGSKYAASLVFYCLLWLPTIGNFALVEWISAGHVEVPQGQLLGSCVILIFMGLFNLAVGCFASSLTSNQIVAAVVSFTISLMHFLLGVFVLYTGRMPEVFVEAMSYIASVEHVRTFSSGLLDTRPLVYYASMAALFLGLTHQVVEFRRWRP